MAGSTNAPCPTVLKGDVDRQVAEVDRVLRASGDHTRCTQALATLGRRQCDGDVGQRISAHSERPVWEPERDGWDEV